MCFWNRAGLRWARKCILGLVNATSFNFNEQPLELARLPRFAAILSVWLFSLSVAGADILESLDLTRPVRAARIPLLNETSGATRGFISFDEIRLESQRMGPFRLGALKGPVIEAMILQLPRAIQPDDTSWAASLAEIVDLKRYPAPVKINGLSIRRGEEAPILQAKNAVYDADHERLEMSGVTLKTVKDAKLEIERVWLILGGDAAGFLVWRDPSSHQTKTLRLLDLGTELADFSAS
jgi:hypothetical protein